jgi:hypothetical protein
MLDGLQDKINMYVSSTDELDPQVVRDARAIMAACDWRGTNPADAARWYDYACMTHTTRPLRLLAVVSPTAEVFKLAWDLLSCRSVHPADLFWLLSAHVEEDVAMAAIDVLASVDDLEKGAHNKAYHRQVTFDQLVVAATTFPRRALAFVDYFNDIFGPALLLVPPQSPAVEEETDESNHGNRARFKLLLAFLASGDGPSATAAVAKYMDPAFATNYTQDDAGHVVRTLLQLTTRGEPIISTHTPIATNKEWPDLVRLVLSTMGASRKDDDDDDDDDNTAANFHARHLIETGWYKRTDKKDLDAAVCDVLREFGLLV